MDDEDFEVLPRGTIEELRVMRSIANELNRFGHEGFVDKDVDNLIKTVQRFYATHNKKYPSHEL